MNDCFRQRCRKGIGVMRDKAGADGRMNGTGNRSNMRLGGTVIGILLGWLVCGQAATINVPGDFATIQAAIDSSVDGDEVVIQPGTYTGTGNRNLDFGGRLITVRSIDPNNPEIVLSTVIDCEGDFDQYYRGFYFHNGETSDAIVSGLTVQHGFREGTGAIRISGSNPTIKQCVIRDNYLDIWGLGSAITCQNSQSIIIDCVIENNHTHFDGGGAVGIDGNSSVTMKRCLIRNNSSGLGGGLYLEGGTIDLEDCRIVDNRSQQKGGGIYGGATGHLENCVIAGNESTSNGSVIFATGVDFTFINCTIADNHNLVGAGLRFKNNSSLTMSNSIVWGNGPQAITFDSGVIAIDHSTIEGGWSGTGNINSDPQFLFAEDYHPANGSPSIDAGSNIIPDGLAANDLDGNARLIDGDGDVTATVDMGAYEYQPNLAVITTAPERMEITAFVNESKIMVEQVEIRNSGGGGLNWQISENCGWLDVLPASGGPLTTGGSETIQVSIDPNGLAVGDHYCVLVVEDSVAGGIEREFEVTLKVRTIRHVPGDYATIQVAVNASVDGDEVVVQPGTYSEFDINLGSKVITVRSAQGAQTCIIELDTGHDGFWVGGNGIDGAIIDGLTVTNGDGFLCGNKAIIRNCIVRNNTKGIDIIEGGATIDTCQVINNQSYGIKVAGSPSVLIHSSITGNGHQGVRFGGGQLKISYCEISDNADNGVHLSSGDFHIDHCLIQGNQTNGSSGSGDSGITIDNLGGWGRITNCVILDNEGYGISWHGSSSHTGTGEIKHCIVRNSHTPIYAPLSNVVVAYCNIEQDGWPLAWIGITTEEVDLTPDGHFIAGSAGIDDGEAAGLAVIEDDIDGENVYGPAVDIGLDEFIDTDGDRVPDWYEARYFGSATAAIAGEDPDNDGLTTREEYELYGSDPNTTNRTIYVDAQRPDDTGDGLSWATAKRTIQAGIDAAVNNGERVVIAEGIYSGIGNLKLNPNGREIIIQSVDPLEPTVVSGTIIRNLASATSTNPNDFGSGFILRNYEGNGCRISGLTIMNCMSITNLGSGGIACRNSSPTIEYCVLKGNIGYGYFSVGEGSAIACKASRAIIKNSLIAYNQALTSSGGGVSCVDSSNVQIIQCTLADNVATNNGLGGGVYVDATSRVRVQNSIVWNNSDVNGMLESSQISGEAANIDIDYSCVKNLTGALGGVGNIGSDPLFVENGDWDDKGTPSPFDDTYIAGKYHLQSQAGRFELDDLRGMDYNWDGAIDLFELMLMAEHWLTSYYIHPGNYNGDWLVDLRDFTGLNQVYLADPVLSTQWVPDGLMSPCIDAGDPMSDWHDEPEPAGRRVNMGVYGGTAYASHSFYSADLDSDGDIDKNDLAILTTRWLQRTLHWSLDEHSGSVAAESFGGYDGILHNFYTNDIQWRAGYINNALGFDGINDYVEIVGYKGVNGTASRTVTAWIKTSMTGEIISWGNNFAGEKWIFRVQDSNGSPGAIRVEVSSGYIVGTTDVCDGLWHHVAAVLVDDGSPDVSEILLYVDGSLESVSASLAHPIQTAAAENVAIGVFLASGRYFNGKIDDVWIYERALTASEIANIALHGQYNYADLSGDGVTDYSDFTILNANWMAGR